jgi:ABC-type transport system involved in multi-copper enzyme maturation permease subunit
MPGIVLTLVQNMISAVSAFGSLLAAWLGAVAIAEELRSGTILPVLARPVHRWQFLLGKYLGVLLMLAVYALCLDAGFSYFLAGLGGQQILTPPWALVVYPIIRYALYAALALLLATRIHPVSAFSIVLVAQVAEYLVGPASTAAFLPGPVKEAAYILLPSGYLLAETRFLTITQVSLVKTAWTTHGISLAYGLDYALVCFLLAVWSFQRRSVTQD